MYKTKVSESLSFWRLRREPREKTQGFRRLRRETCQRTEGCRQFFTFDPLPLPLWSVRFGAPRGKKKGGRIQLESYTLVGIGGP